MVAALSDQQHAGAGQPRASPLLLCCFYLLGMGVVCNWVALLQCQDYLGPLFTAYSPSRVLTAAYAALDLLAQSLLFFFGDRLWANKHSRMVVGYAACTAVTAALPLLDMYLLDTAAAALGPQAATAAYFGAWAGYSLVAGACSAIIGSVTYAQAAVYGPSYCQAFVRGRAASGLSCILVRVLTKATLPDNPAGLRQSTLLFLGAAAALLAACTAAASWLPKEAPGKAAAAAVSVGFFVPCFIFPAMLSPEAGSWPAVGSWWTIMLVGAFQAGAVAGSALPLYSIQHPQRFISLLAWGQWAVVPATLAALALHGGPLALLGITFGSMVYGYHVASLVFWLACEGLGSAADVELVQGLLVLTLTAARLAGLLLSWLWG
ncbi:hypothetical protein OEZ85_010001 [Tetradesmus obliquus]|uniref:Uncharacterized protein n=1 Tax=Tetradesmus obliquus TaxID=3088 RepID=A0ABY8UFW2_TETOB|nr:hypothetical protein OEZ85_010001 [Tetradesmus obliquus]